MLARMALATAGLAFGCTGNDVGRRSQSAEVGDASVPSSEDDEEAPVEEPPSFEIPVPTGPVTAVPLAPGYGERALAHAKAQRDLLQDANLYFAKMAEATPVGSTLAVVVADKEPAPLVEDDVLYDMAVKEVILGKSPGERLRIVQSPHSGLLGECGDLHPKLGETRVVLVAPIDETNYRLVRIDDYYNGWFYQLDQNSFRVDRGPKFNRSAFAVLEPKTGKP